MSDKRFLSWPFFSDKHRKLYTGAEKWASAEMSEVSHQQDEHTQTVNIVKMLGSAGWLKYAVPSDFGGVFPGLDVRSLCLLRETFSRFASLGDFAFAMQGLGSGPISLFGSETQKKRYLPRVASGSLIASFAISEPETGSDIAAITTTVRKEGEQYLINGTKTWISNVGIADFYLTFARDQGKSGSETVSAFIVDADSQGIKTEKIDILSPHPLGTVTFENCRVSADKLVGQAGRGLSIALTTLDLFRPTVGAAALGMARKALKCVLARVHERSVFGKPLRDFQMTKEKIADMATEIDASALLVYRAAWAHDTGNDPMTREASMAKMFATESAQRVIDSAVQLFGASGLVTNTEVEALYRDIRPLRIYEGTTEIQKLIIAREMFREYEQSQVDLP